MTIVATITCICDICRQAHAHTEVTYENDEITIILPQMAEGWSTVWIDDNNCDTVCGQCLDKYASQVEIEFTGRFWTKRPTSVGS